MSLTLFVTGVTAGFGRAIARRFIADGHRVIGVGRRAERLAELHTELGDNFLPMQLDVTDLTAVDALPQTLPAAWRDIDVLVNNAGLALGTGPAQQADLADWDLMVNTNISGLIHVTRALLPGMVARNKGTIVNIGSTAGRYAYPGGNVYCASKAFVEQFSLCLRADLVANNIRVTDIMPGLVGGTEFSHVRFHGDAQKADAVYQNTKPLDENDIAEAVHWVVNLPDHVNINVIEMMPTCQAPGPLAISRQANNK